jgi:hypothetical protein
VGERRVGGEAQAVAAVAEGYPGAVEHVGGELGEREPLGGAKRNGGADREEERDAATAGDVVHDVREAQVIGFNVEVDRLGDADRGFHDRLASGQLTGRRLVSAVTVTGIRPLAQHDAFVADQQKIDVNDDAAARCAGYRVVAHGDCLCPTLPLPWPKHATAGWLWIAMCVNPGCLWMTVPKTHHCCGLFRAASPTVQAYLVVEKASHMWMTGRQTRGRQFRRWQDGAR